MAVLPRLIPLGTPITVAGLQGVTAVACGGYFSCGLSGGAAYCWGSNYSARLGGGKTYNELGATATPVAVAGVTTAVSLAAGPMNGCVALASGSVQCWGLNNNGQMGTLPPFAQDVPFPTTVAGIAGPMALTIGQYHVCGLLPAGTIKCWGSDTPRQPGGRSLDESVGHTAGRGWHQRSDRGGRRPVRYLCDRC